MIKEIALASIVSFGETHIDQIDPFDVSYQCGVNQNRFDRVIQLSIDLDLSISTIYDSSKTVRKIVATWIECKSRGYDSP